MPKKLYGVKNKPTPNNPMMRKGFEPGDEKQEQQKPDVQPGPKENSPVTPIIKPLIDNDPEVARISLSGQETASSSSSETAAVKTPPSQPTAKPRLAVRVTMQLGIPTGMMEQLSKLADESRLDAEYLAEAVITKTLSQIASSPAISHDAPSMVKPDFSLSRKRSFVVDGETVSRVRAKLDPLNVKPVAHIARAIYMSTLPASFDEVKADVLKKPG